MAAKSSLESLMDVLRDGGMGFAGGPMNPDNGGGDGGNGNPPEGGAPQPEMNLPRINISEKMGAWNKKSIIIFSIVLVLVLAGAYWWFHPAINIHSQDLWIFLAVFVLAPLFLLFRAKRKKYQNGTDETLPDEQKAKKFKFLSWIPLGVLAIGLLGGLLSLSFIPGNAYKYADILKIENLDFAEDIQQVDYSQIPVIDRATAIVLGNKEMGTIADYVSQFEVSNLYSQINYNGKPVRVSPLGYADLFKWLINRPEGIPAYIMIDMTTQDADIIRISNVDGTTGQGIKYSESEPLARNIQRYVQLRFPFYMFDDFSFEIDDNGHPWWICPVQSRTIGLFGGTTISKVILCDAVSGECFEYAIEECPQWVDRAYPAELLVTQFNWHGSYLNGWINSWLGQNGVVQSTPGTNGKDGYNYIAKDDDVWVYTGVTSATSDSSIIGFILINQRTAEAHFYSVVGATEDSAMSSAEGQVQNLRYTATFPILINVSDQPTYFLALKDAAGLVKKFAMIDIQRYQNVAVGDTVAECQTNYIKLLETNGVIDPDSQSGDVLSYAGTVSAVYVVTINGNTHFYVEFGGAGSALYDFNIAQFPNMVKLTAGSYVSFEYVAGAGGLNTVTKIN
ncbi:MAG: Tat pathway signal sequence [Eggerthellaceae bacterium]|nr:Tat pathway signal sequence [Eggerthellaceae bacterium]